MLTTILALVVSATIDSTTLFIGDQTDLHLRATCEVGEQVQLPVLAEQLVDGIEILDRTIVDTTTLNDGRVQYNQYLTLTSFTDSLFYIAPLPFVSGDDTVWSESMMLNVVQPFEMDSTDLAITDIKGIYRAPIWWWAAKQGSKCPTASGLKIINSIHLIQKSPWQFKEIQYENDSLCFRRFRDR